MLCLNTHITCYRCFHTRIPHTHHTHTREHTHTHTHSLSLSRSLSLTHTHSHTHAHAHTHSYTHTQTNTHILISNILVHAFWACCLSINFSIRIRMHHTHRNTKHKITHKRRLLTHAPTRLHTNALTQKHSQNIKNSLTRPLAYTQMHTHAHTHRHRLTQTHTKTQTRTQTHTHTPDSG